MDREGNRVYSAMVYPAMIGLFALVIVTSAWFNVGQVVQTAESTVMQPPSSPLDVPTGSSKVTVHKPHRVVTSSNAHKKDRASVESTTVTVR